MAKILPKRSSVGGNTPDTTDLADGEIAINYADRKIYGRSGNSIVTLSAPVGSTSYTTTVGNGVDTSFDVIHNLDTENIVFSVLDKTNNDYEQVTTEYVDDNTTRFTFSSAPSTNKYSITISSGGGGGANIMQSIAVNMILN